LLPLSAHQKMNHGSGYEKPTRLQRSRQSGWVRCSARAGRGIEGVCIATAPCKKVQTLALAVAVAVAERQQRQRIDIAAPDTPRQRHTNTKAQKTKRQTGREAPHWRTGAEETQKLHTQRERDRELARERERGRERDAVTATARHVYGQKAYAAAAAATTAAAETTTAAAATPAVRQATSQRQCRPARHRHQSVAQWFTQVCTQVKSSPLQFTVELLA